MAHLTPVYTKGTVTLIDFWATWCVPCRKELPALKALYQKYKDKGFTITSISFDTNPLLWQSAIKKENLSWTHLCDGKAWNGTAAQIYGIKTIPTNFLINEQGIIIAKNLSAEFLDAALAQLFQKGF